jgi:type VI secretion system protein ImpK
MSDIDDPFKPSSDATILRPRPGAGRRSAGDPPPSPPAPAAAAAPRRQTAPPVDTPAPLSRELAGPGLNPLVQAASPLLVIAGQLRTTLSVADVGGLRRQIVDEMHRFEERALAAGVRRELVLAGRYALCTAIDEAALSTPWGSQSEWPQQTLLLTFHRETFGGEKFYEMLDRVSGDPSKIDLVELQYLCIALGFAGKYRGQGQGQLADVEQDLSRKIREHRGAPQSELSPHWRGLEDRRSRLIRYVPWWVFGAAALATLTVAFFFFYTSLARTADPVQKALGDLSQVRFFSANPTTPSSGPTLKALLAADEQRQALSVKEDGGRTTITLPGGDMFSSGSAEVNAAYNELLQHITRALNQVPGQVFVVGHTDGQPLHSLRYPNNSELSRERALNVVNLLKRGIDDPARFKWRGLGSSEPLVPETDDVSRAMNRRVEIFHVRG